MSRHIPGARRSNQRETFVVCPECGELTRLEGCAEQEAWCQCGDVAFRLVRVPMAHRSEHHEFGLWRLDAVPWLILFDD